MEGGGGSVGKCRERDGELKETNCSVACCRMCSLHAKLLLSGC